MDLRTTGLRVLLAAGAMLQGACAFTEPTETRADFEDRMKRRNDTYAERMERRKIRDEARDERYDIWWNKIMGR